LKKEASPVSILDARPVGLTPRTNKRSHSRYTEWEDFTTHRKDANRRKRCRKWNTL